MLKPQIEASEAGVVVTAEGERIQLVQGGVDMAFPETAVQELIDALVTVGGTVQKNRRTEQLRQTQQKVAEAAAEQQRRATAAARPQR